MRPVIDLSILHTYLVVLHFKMETNRSIRASILPGMWTTFLDLSDAYFHIPICHSYHRYLRFAWDNRVYQFGLSTAPLVFAGSHSSSAFPSYSDSFLHGQLSDQGTLGFLFSWIKSDLITSHDFIFLGKRFLTQQGLVLPPQEKFQILCSRVHLFLSQKTVTARQFSQLLGLLNSLADVVPLGRLHIRPLHFYLHQHWPQHLRIGTVQFRLFIRTCLLIFYCGLFKGTL